MMAVVSGITASPSTSTGTLPLGDVFRIFSCQPSPLRKHQILVERDSKMLQHQPGAQRPARIVAVGKDQFHGKAPNRRSHNDARPRNPKKPTTSVTVVTNTDEATAGSILSRLRRERNEDTGWFRQPSC